MQKQTRQRKAKQRFAVASRLEKEYERSLRAIVANIDAMIKGLMRKDMTAVEVMAASSKLTHMLQQYSSTIQPWATSIVGKMAARIDKTDEASWVQLGKQMNRSLKKELNDAPTGNILRAFMAEQVSLITSIPQQAAARVHEMALEAITTGERADSIAKKILETGNITKSRARCIARTEVARTASGLTMARSEFVGSTHYYWRTCGDGDVRESHKHMDGRIIAWAQAPEVEPGKHYHAGMIYNCRCYAEPIIDELNRN
jgi:SPP1 gp7 family putative phage head morphogenesis protein